VHHDATLAESLGRCPTTMLPMRELLSSIESAWHNEGVAFLNDFVALPAISPAFDPHWIDTGGIEGAIELVAQWARHRSIPKLSVKLVRAPKKTPLLIIDVAASANATTADTVVFYGHLDKQPAVGPWRDGTDPFRLVTRGDYLFGRGVVDDGYVAPAVLCALESLAHQHRPYPRCVLILEASEESGSPDLQEHLETVVPTLGRVRAVFALDSGALNFDHLWITSSLRGNLVLTVTVEVLSQGVHSGEAGGVVPSSFRILRQLLSRIEDERTGEILPDFLKAPIPERFIESAQRLQELLGDPLATAFPTVEGLSLLGTSAQERFLNQTFRPSLALTGIAGVPDPLHAGNVLRASTTAKISLRIPPTVDAATASCQLESLLTLDPPNGAKVRVKSEEPANGWIAPELSPRVKEALTRAARDVYRGAPQYCGEGGSIPFLSMLTDLLPGADLIATGAMGQGANAHGPDENLYLPSAIALSQTLALTVTQLATES